MKRTIMSLFALLLALCLCLAGCQSSQSPSDQTSANQGEPFAEVTDDKDF